MDGYRRGYFLFSAAGAFADDLVECEMRLEDETLVNRQPVTFSSMPAATVRTLLLGDQAVAVLRSGGAGELHADPDAAVSVDPPIDLA